MIGEGLGGGTTQNWWRRGRLGGCGMTKWTNWLERLPLVTLGRQFVKGTSSRHFLMDRERIMGGSNTST